jgi:hypothetical protein
VDNLQATEISTSSVKINWEHSLPKTIDYYSIYRNNFLIEDTEEFYLIDKNLYPNSYYSYQIISFGKNMTKASSNTIIIKTSELSDYEKSIITENINDKIQKTILVTNLRDQINNLFSRLNEVLQQLKK